LATTSLSTIAEAAKDNGAKRPLLVPFRSKMEALSPEPRQATPPQH
jgi:hypothetical protein